METAQEIFETLLQITRDALLAGDFENFQECFQLPHFIASAQDKMVLETREDMIHVFQKVTHDYTRKQITDLIRVCEIAEYRTPTRIEAAYLTTMMSGNQHVGDSFPCFSVIELIDGRWKITSSQYAVDTNTAVGMAIDRNAARPSNI